MIEALITHFEKYSPISSEEARFLKENIGIQKVSKNQVLLEEGEISKAFYFLIKGCVRMYYVVGGEEKTAFFYTENQFISSYKSFVHQVPSPHFLQAVEPGIVAVISSEVAALMLERFPKFAFLARIAMEEELTVYQDIIATFITLTPEQRYVNLQQAHPELLQRIPQYQLATYLGVTAETLSRIRKRIGEKGIS